MSQVPDGRFTGVVVANQLFMARRRLKQSNSQQRLEEELERWRKRNEENIKKLDAETERVYANMHPPRISGYGDADSTFITFAEPTKKPE